MKIVINTCYGGFGLSREAGRWLLANGIEEPFKSQIQKSLNRDKKDPLSGGIWCDLQDYPNRTHPLLVKCVKTLGEKANGKYAELEVEEVSGNYFRIDEYDGVESVITPDLDYFIKNKYNEGNR